MKRIINIVLIFLLFIISLVNINNIAYALDDIDGSAPSISLSNATIIQGNSAYLSIDASNFEDISGLDIYVSYDKDEFTLNSYNVSSSDVMDSSIYDINIKEEGMIVLSIINASGMNENGQIMFFYLMSNNNTQIKKHNITLAVGNAYKKDLSNVDINATSGSITVNEKPKVIGNIDFYSSSISNELKINDTQEVNVYTYNASSLASFDLEIEYDNELISIEEINISDSLKNKEGAIYSINNDIKGYIKISYIALEGSSGYLSIVNLKFKVIKNISIDSSINFSFKNIYDSSLNIFNANNVEAKFKVKQEPPVIVYPKFFIKNQTIQNGLIVIDVYAQKDTKIAAGDFYITYDNNVLECVDIKNVINQSMVVGNKKYKENQLRFSFIYENGISKDEVIARISFNAFGACNSTTNLTITGSNITDKDFNKMDVEYVNGTLTFTHTFNDFSIDKEATCEEDGVKSKHCKYCDEKNEETIIPMTGHSYGTWVEEIPATCENDGVKGHYECNSCHKYFDSNKEELNDLVINKLGHNLQHHEKLEPTCIEDGHEEYDTCSRCNYTTYKTIDNLGHDLTHHERLEATCTSIGHEAYDECSRCDYSTYKEIAKLPHDYKEEWSHDENNHYHECKNCGAKADITNHTFTWAIDKDSTCTETGLKHEECEVCGYIRNENTIVELKEHAYGTWIEEVPATCENNGILGHYKCSNCDKYFDFNKKELTILTITKLGHDLTLHAKLDPTCEENGHNAYYTCSRCDYTTYKAIDKLGHSLQHHDKLEPTCIEDGHEEYDTCTRCNYTTYKTINKLGHSLIHHERLEATCTSIGHEAYDECSRCDYSTYKEIAKLPHDYKYEWSHDENSHYHECKNCDAKADVTNHAFTWIIDTEPTEETTGIKHEECETCHYTRNENIIIPTLSHTHNMEHISKKEATCEENGNIEYYHCSKCGNNYSDENGNNEIVDIVIKASHKYGLWIKEVLATCELDGVKAHYECSSCHKYFDINKNEISNLVIDKLGHNLIHHDKLEPTCIEDGYEAYDTCTRCDYTTYKTINKLDHDLVHHERLEATCTSVGHEAYDECSRCDYSTYKEIAKLPHDYKEEWSYDENGHYHECKNCNHKEDESVHSYLWIIDDEPTEETNGIKHEECSVCPSKRNENTLIEKLDHKHQMEHVNKKEATCEEDGNVEYYHCIKCNKNYADENGSKSLESIIINAIGHSYGTWIEEISATCEQDGVKAHYECSNCHKYFDSSKEKLNDLTINKLGHNLIHHDKLEPTCIEDGYEEYDTCSRCDYTTYITIKKLGHDLTHYERLEATCTSIGHEAYDECSRCDYTTYKEIAKKPHDYKVEWSYDENGHYHECKNCDAKIDATNHTFTWIIDKDSTCKEEGLKHEECEVCHYTRNENTVIELKEHTIVVDKAVEATCTSTGLTEGKHCSVCNEILVKQEETAKKEHTFTEWHVVKEATTKEEGKEERTCSSCNTTESRSIAKITNKGCKGSIATSIITLITCLGLLLHFRKKYN